MVHTRRRSLAVACGLAFSLALIVALALWPAAAAGRPGAGNGSQSETIQFEDRALSAGLLYSDGTFGAGWGDFNADGWPDLWVGNHFSAPPSLYLNQGDGTFVDIAGEVWSGQPFADTHGLAWADYDNDGDQDMAEMVGAEQGIGLGPNHLYENNAGLLVNRGEEYGVDLPLGRGRTPLWFDADRDGRLDLLLTNLKRGDGLAPSTLYIQGDGVFEALDVGFVDADHMQFAMLGDLNGDRRPDLVTHGWPFPQNVYDLGSVPLQSIRTELGLPGFSTVSDAIIDDFTGDLNPDIYMLRSEDVSDLELFTAQRLHAYMLVEGDEKGAAFVSDGDITVTFHNFTLFGNPDYVHIGASGWHPEDCCAFMLSADDPDVVGILEHTSGEDSGIYVGYDPGTQTWQVLASSSGEYVELSTIIESSLPISDVQTIGFDPAARFQFHRYQVYQPNGYVDATEEGGFSEPISCPTGVSGDFDNDMDLDIYLLCTREVTNLNNLYFENQGDGRFVQVDGVAPGSDIGSGDALTTVDYDRDGFLDLFITNGESTPPFQAGNHTLYRNLGNGNHWLEIDLIGNASNRDGIGARVEITAGGVTQLREQDGGIHRWAQNHQRLHVGLGPNTTVDWIKVFWPSGITTIYADIPADQVIQIAEPSAPTGRTNFIPATLIP